MRKNMAKMMVFVFIMTSVFAVNVSNVQAAPSLSITSAPNSFSVMVDNDGTIHTDNSLTVTISGKTGSKTNTFKGQSNFNITTASTGIKITAGSLPAGLSIKANSTEGSTAMTISLSGKLNTFVTTGSVTLTFYDEAINNANINYYSNPQIFNIIFYRQPTLTYSGMQFSETPTNNGSISTILTATLTNGAIFTTDSATGSDLPAGSYSITPCPAGLTPKVTKTASNKVDITFTGTATSNQSSNNSAYSNITIQFNGAAFENTLLASNVINNPKSGFSIVFADNPGFSYSTTSFIEAAANDGSISPTSLTVTINGSQTAFSGSVASSLTFPGLPAGLNTQIVRNSDTSITINLTGTAINHQSSNNTNFNISFADTAFTNNYTAAAVLNSNQSFSISFKDNPTLAYSADALSEVPANDGQITPNTITVNRPNSGNYYFSTNAKNYISIANVPAGITTSVAISGSSDANRSVIITFSGTAVNHQMADNTNITVTFADSAFMNGVKASDIAGTVKDIPVTFMDNPALTYEGGEFIENYSNDGSIANSKMITLSGGTKKFSGANGSIMASSKYSVNKALSGTLAPVVTKISDTQVSLSFSGNASPHEFANSVTDYSITFKASAFDDNSTVGMYNLTKSDIWIMFTNASNLTYEPGAFSEAKINDGSIGNTKTVVVEGVKLANTVFKEGVHFKTTNVPAGLTLSAIRVSDNWITLSLQGKAVNHTSANNISNMKIQFLDAAFAYKNAAQVSYSTNSTLSINYINNNPIRVLEVYPSTISGTDGNKKVLSALDSGYAVTSMSLNKFISLTDDINGNYDIIYFGNGRYFCNGVNENKYGNDITDRRAKEVIKFIQSGQLCIFDQTAFNVDTVDTSPVARTKMYTNFNSLVGSPAYMNAVKATSATDAIDKIKTAARNQAPVLSMYEKPLSYKAMETPLSDRMLKFRYRADDPDGVKATSTSAITLSAILYIDKNNDSIFKDNEAVVKHVVVTGEADTIIYPMPESLTGNFFWKLELTDARGAKDEIVDVIHLKGTKENIVRVLQIVPTVDGNTGPLVSLFNTPIPNRPGETIGYSAGEYRITVTQVTADEFQNPPANDTRHLNELNGNYDMLVLGFADSYLSKNLNTFACDKIYGFIKTGQSVMFTHDLVAYPAYQSTWNLRDYKPSYSSATGTATSTIDFRAIIGQTPAISAGQIRRDNSLTNLINSYQLGNYNLLNVDGNPPPSYVKKVNSSAITLYPYNLENIDQSAMQVATTHLQYYKLNLEDEAVIPLFNLYKNDPNVSERLLDDSMNNFYTYSYGNITYSGTGHSSGYPNYEIRMFANTMMKAYSSSNHAPEISVFKPENNSKLDAGEGYLDLSFLVADFDPDDSTVNYEVSADWGAGYVVEKTAQVDNNTRVSITDIKKKKIGVFKLKIRAWDDQGAETQPVILTLNNTKEALLKPEVSVSDEELLVGESFSYYVRVNASGYSDTASTTAGPILNITQNVSDNIIPLKSNISAGTFEFSDTTTPSPIYIDNGPYTTVAALGLKSIDATVNYSLGATAQPVQSGSASMEVRRQEVQVFIRDEAGKQIKNATLRMDSNSIGTSQGGENSIVLMGNQVSAGSHTFDAVLPAGLGYSYESTRVGKVTYSSGYMDYTNPTWSDGNTINVDFENPVWIVEIKVKLNMNISLEYYHLLNDNAVVKIGGSQLNVLRNTHIRIAAKVILSDVSGNSIETLNFNNLKTYNKTGSDISSDLNYGASVTNTAVTIKNSGSTSSPFYGVTQLKESNTTTGNYAGKSYYIVIDIPKANNQSIKMESIEIIMESGTPYPNFIPNGVTIINIKDLPFLQ